MLRALRVAFQGEVGGVPQGTQCMPFSILHSSPGIADKFLAGDPKEELRPAD